MIPLQGKYYAECNEVFRRATDQADRMLEEIQPYLRQKKNLDLLSVGSGVGLFEIPMLRTYLDEIRSFVGLDISRYACEVLERKLEEEFEGKLEYSCVNLSFQEYRTDRSFDLLIFSHTFEYFDGDRLPWIQKSVDLLGDSGRVLIFSPNRGGINEVYAGLRDPFFSEDLEELLTRNGIPHEVSMIDARCDIVLLDDADQNQDKLRLLSFLTQMDCRQVSPHQREEYINYYRSLRPAHGSAIPHPATLFIL